MKTVTVHKADGMKCEQYAVTVHGTELANAITELDNEVEVVVDGKRVARGLVDAAWGGPIAHIPAVFLEKHHDAVCRTYSGLWMVLSVLQGSEVNADTPVTVLLIRAQPDSKIEITSEGSLAGRFGRRRRNAP